jgi:hypothetical protein
VAQADIRDLLATGFSIVTVADTALNFLGKLIGANMNVTTDQAIALSEYGLDPAYTKLYVDRIVVTNASVSLTTAVGGVYTAASKGGTALVANTQAYSGLTAATLAIELTLAAARPIITPPGSVYFSLTTAQGAAATADIYVFGTVLG